MQIVHMDEELKQTEMMIEDQQENPNETNDNPIVKQLGYTPIQFPRPYIRLTRKNSPFDKKSVHYHTEKLGPEFYVNPDEYEKLKRKAFSDSNDMKKPDKILDPSRHPKYQRCFRILRDIIGNDFIIEFPSDRVIKNIYHSSQLIIEDFVNDGTDYMEIPKK